MIQIHQKPPEGVRFKPRNKAGLSNLPFDQLEVGQCFLAPVDQYHAGSVKVLASRKSTGAKKFSTHKSEEGLWVRREA